MHDLVNFFKVLADEKRLLILLQVQRMGGCVHWKRLHQELDTCTDRDFHQGLAMLRAMDLVLNDGDGYVSINWPMLRGRLEELCELSGLPFRDLCCSLGISVTGAVAPAST